MRHRSSISAPTNTLRRGAPSWRGSVFRSRQQGKHECAFMNIQQRNCSWQSTRTSITACMGSNTTVLATTFPASHEPACALNPSQLADELQHYASAAAAAGRRPGNDPFLATCLSELSPAHRLRRLHPRQLASLLRSLAHLGVHPGEDWLADLDSCCYCHPGPFDPASATAVLQALAELHTAASATASQATAAPAESASSAGTPPQVPVSAKAQQRYRDQQRVSRQRQRQQQQQHRWEQWREAGAGLAPTSADASAAVSGSLSVTPAPFRFPHAVYLRLLQGGVYNYSYEQLATLLQSFRSLGVPVSDDLALQVGSRMAAQLLEMATEQRHAALAAVLGGSGGGGAGYGCTV